MLPVVTAAVTAAAVAGVAAAVTAAVGTVAVAAREHGDGGRDGEEQRERGGGQRVTGCAQDRQCKLSGILRSPTR